MKAMWLYIKNLIIIIVIHYPGKRLYMNYIWLFSWIVSTAFNSNTKCSTEQQNFGKIRCVMNTEIFNLKSITIDFILNFSLFDYVCYHLKATWEHKFLSPYLIFVLTVTAEPSDYIMNSNTLMKYNNCNNLW